MKVSRFAAAFLSFFDSKGLGVTPDQTPDFISSVVDMREHYNVRRMEIVTQTIAVQNVGDLGGLTVPASEIWEIYAVAAGTTDAAFAGGRFVIGVSISPNVGVAAFIPLAQWGGATSTAIARPSFFLPPGSSVLGFVTLSNAAPYNLNVQALIVRHEL